MGLAKQVDQTEGVLKQLSIGSNGQEVEPVYNPYTLACCLIEFLYHDSEKD